MKQLLNKLICRLFGHAEQIYCPRITNTIRAKQICIDRYRVIEEYKCRRCGKVLRRSFFGEMNPKEMRELCNRIPQLKHQSK